MNWKKAIALVLILALMAAGGYFLLKAEKDDDDRMRSLYSEVEPLERQREELQAELDNLDTEYATKNRDYATVEILFTELDNNIISEVWPLMKERGVVGMLAMNYREIPGFYYKLTTEDIQRLVADGWGTCILQEGAITTAFPNWYRQFSNQMHNLKLPVPTTIYYNNKVYEYDPAMNDMLAECGITTVVLNASDGRSMTVTDPTDSIWITGAMPFGYTGSATDLELLGRTDGGNIVLTMKLDEPWADSYYKNGAFSQQKASFISILDSWKDYLYEEDPMEEMETVEPTPYIYVDTEDPEVLHQIYLDSLTPEQKLLLPMFRSVNLDTAYQLHRAAAEGVDTVGQERTEREDQLRSQIAALDVQIRDIYEAHGVSREEENRQGS